MIDMTGFQTTLGEISSLRRGVSYTGADLCESDGTPMINLKSFAKSGEYRPEGIKFNNGSFKDRDLIKPDEIILANTDLTKEGDILGAAVMTPSEFNGKDVIGSHHTTILTLIDDRVVPLFLNFLLNTDKVRLEIKRYRRGATVKGITSGDLKRLVLRFPPAEEQRRTIDVLKKMLKGVESAQRLKEGYELAFRSFSQTNLE